MMRMAVVVVAVVGVAAAAMTEMRLHTYGGIYRHLRCLQCREVEVSSRRESDKGVGSSLGKGDGSWMIDWRSKELNATREPEKRKR